MKENVPKISPQRKTELRELAEARKGDLIKFVGPQNTGILFKFLLSLKSTNTRRAYFRDLIHFFKFLKEKKREMSYLLVTRSDVDHYKEVLRRYGPEGKSPSTDSTIKRKLAATSKFYKFLIREDILKANPVEHVERPKVPLEVKTEIFSIEEFKEMLAIFDEPTERNLLKKALLLLQVTTGLRIGEILSLKNGDYIREGKRGFLKVKSTKSSKFLTKELSQPVKEALDLYLLQKDEIKPRAPLLCGIHHKDQPLKQGSAYKIIRTAAKEIGLNRKINNHSARAFFITQALDHVSLGEVQSEVGHSSIVMTNEYDKRRRDNSKKLGDALFESLQ
ncbi:MAG: tyrosine-type recombinase/integrase [Halobacteriovoraceae bacterium]|nr:tyrosine-type recombinase/integrase [Halobacteriovoraceae bacterium]